MLSKQALSTAADQVQNMEARGVIVAPLPGSILDTAVRACHVPPDAAWRNEDGTYSLGLDSLEYFANSKDSVTGFCEHDQTQEELACKIGDQVAGYLLHARTIVAPAVEDFVKNMDEALQVYRGQIAHDFEIVTMGLPAPLADKSLIDSIEKAEAVTASEFELPILSLGSNAYAQVAELLRTGSTGLDSAIDAWASSLGEDYFVKVWDQLFGNAGMTNASTFFSDTAEGNNNLLAAFLLARTLHDNPPEGANVSLNRYNDKMFDLRTQAGARLSARMVSAKNLEENGALVLSSYGRRINVNGPVYTKWIKAGGENEVLFGNALKSMPAVMVDDIDAGAAESKRAWERYAAMKKLDFDNRMFTKFKDTARIEFARVVANASHDEMSMVEREEICRRFEEALNISVIEESKDLYCWCLRLLATSWFYKSDAYFILKTICDLRQASPDLEPAQAAALAAIKYISFWLSRQMMLRRPGMGG